MRVRPVWGVWLAFGALVGVLAYWSFATFLLLAVLVPAGVVLLILVLVHGVRGLVGRQPAAWGRMRQRALGVAYCAALAVVVVHGTQTLVSGVRREIVAAADALQRYHADRGGYPEELRALVPAYLPAPPRCPGSAMETMVYWRDGDARYVLTCYTVVFAKLSYDSATRAWRTWD